MYCSWKFISRPGAISYARLRKRWTIRESEMNLMIKSPLISLMPKRRSTNIEGADKERTAHTAAEIPTLHTEEVLGEDPSLHGSRERAVTNSQQNRPDEDEVRAQLWEEVGTEAARPTEAVAFPTEDPACVA